MSRYARFHDEIRKLSSELRGDATAREFIEFASEILDKAIKQYEFHVPSDIARSLDDVLDIASDDGEEQEVVKYAWLEQFLNLLPFARDWISEVLTEKNAAYCLKRYIKPSGIPARDRKRAEAIARAILPAGAGTHVLRRKDRKTWEIGWKDVRFELPARLTGLFYIQQLLTNPEKEISASELYSSAQQLTDSSLRQAAEITHGQSREGEFSHTAADDTGEEMFDKQTLNELKDREIKLSKLISSAEELLSLPSTPADRRLEVEIDLREWQEELDQVLEYRKKSTSCFRNGEVSTTRRRNFSPPGEKARQNVFHAIQNAICRIAEVSPTLAEFLTDKIKTGNICKYTPPTDNPPNWQCY